MIRILYFSQSTRDITDPQVRDILESSRRNNPSLGITGVLIHGGGMFMQVLEGPKHSTHNLPSDQSKNKSGMKCFVPGVTAYWSRSVMPCAASTLSSM